MKLSFVFALSVLGIGNWNWELGIGVVFVMCFGVGFVLSNLSAFVCFILSSEEGCYVKMEVVLRVSFRR